MADIKTGIFAKNVQKRLNRAQEKVRSGRWGRRRGQRARGAKEAGWQRCGAGVAGTPCPRPRRLQRGGTGPGGGMPGPRGPGPGGARSAEPPAPSPPARLAALPTLRAGARHERPQVRREGCLLPPSRAHLPPGARSPLAGRQLVGTRPQVGAGDCGSVSPPGAGVWGYGVRQKRTG